MSLNKLKSYIVDGELRQHDGDGGDSSQRDATLILLSTIAGYTDTDLQNDLGVKYETLVKNHETMPAVYRRTNDKTHWGYNPNNFSRDQWSILQLAFAVRGDKLRLAESMIAMMLRFGFHQNVHVGTNASPKVPYGYKIPDLPHPSHYSVFIRGMSLSILRPLLYILDLVLLADLYFRKGRIYDADNMLSQHILFANYKYPTFISKYALKLYLKTDFMAQIERYHMVDSDHNGIAPLPDLFKEAFNAIVK